MHDRTRLQQVDIKSLFDADAERLTSMSFDACNIYVDFSKQLVDGDVLAHLLRLAEERHLASAIEELFGGGIVNPTENRAALHTLLRSPLNHEAPAAHQERIEIVKEVRGRMAKFSHDINAGGLCGHGGARIRDVVSIGIGGSHLGPALVCDALSDRRGDSIRVHFVSNVDGGALHRVLETLKPETTHFIVASKSFNTAETLLNARSAKTWIQDYFNDAGATKSHFSAVTANPSRALEFGIERDNIFPMWDWVGGRYSLWSAIGLPITIALGSDGFDRLLAGAYSMDEHFRSSAIASNIPVLLALIGIWNTNFLGSETHAVVPYDDRLEQLPAFLQQLEMESNGKRISLSNELTAYDTAPILWGGVGTNAQHAFFQQLHQGTRFISIDFIFALTHQVAPPEHHDMLIANCIAQAEALMLGRNADSLADIENDAPHLSLAMHRECPGNRPSTTIVLEALTPESLGALIALYEHKTYVQGVIWDINSFDQWGVELGKNLADTILQELARGEAGNHDPSTAALIKRYLAHRKS